MRTKTISRSAGAVTLLAMTAFSPQVLAELGCPAGFVPDGNERFTDSAFANGFDSFNSDIDFRAPLGDYPTDANGTQYTETGIGILTGDYASPDGIVSQVAFPGDDSPAEGVAAVAGVDTWFAYNGNNTDSPRMIWESTLTGLKQNTEYAFTAYFSNALAPLLQADGFVAPLVSFKANGTEVQGAIAVCDAGGGLQADNSCANFGSEDLWNRLGITVNTGSETTLALSIHDAQQTTSAGNDFAFTLISFQECQPIAPVGIDSDLDGIFDDEDIDDDNDGILDVDEGLNNGNHDFDGDGVPNRLDLDSDNDGISDIREALGTDGDNDGRVADPIIDDNQDGYHDPLVANPWEIPDTDNDGAKDFLDLDSDNDGKTDIEEAGLTDSNGDGVVDTNPGPANNGWDPAAQAATAGALPDEDNDSLPDYRDVPDAPTAVLPETGEQGEVITRIDGGVGSLGLGLLLPLLGAGAIRRRRMTAVVAAAALGFSVSAHAEQGQFYIGAGLGASQLEPEVINIPDLEVDDENDFGGKLFLGYDLLDWLSIEGYAATLGAAGFNNGGEIDYDVLGATFVANLPHNSPGLSFLGKLGFADIQNDSSTIDYREVESTEITAGIGAEYQFDNQFSLRGEYEYYDKDAQLISLSLLKRFGGQEPPPPAPIPVPVPAPAPPPVVPPAPEPPAPEPAPIKIIRLNIEPIYFDTDMSFLREEAKVSLGEVAGLLNTYPEVELMVVGHTDSRAPDSYNMGLSLARAKSAVKYLETLGIAGSRMTYEARGEVQPAAENNTPQGRQLNRRVEFFPTPDEVQTVIIE